MNKQGLIDKIQDKIFTNPNRRIKGDTLQEILKLIVENIDIEFITEGQSFSFPLEKNNISDLRNSSEAEIILIKSGIVEYVRVLGYYEKGDTPIPINYYISNTSKSDDGGSVIDVGDIKINHNFISKVDARYFGVKNESGYDNDSNLKNIEEYLYDNPRKTFVLEGSGSGNFETSGTFSIPRNINVTFRNATLEHTGYETGNFLTIGEPGERHSHVKIEGLKVSQTLDWDRDFSGVVFHGMYYSEVSVIDIRGFRKGMVMMADDNGVVYNKITVNRISDCQNHLKLTSINGGWTNENLWMVNELQTTSSAPSGMDITGVLITSEDEGYVNNNKNHFVKPSFEIGKSDNSSIEIIAIHVEHGSHNNFVDCRFEGIEDSINGTGLIRCENLSRGNVFEINYKSNSTANKNQYLDDRSDGNDFNYIKSSDRIANTHSSYGLIYSSGNLNERVSQYNSTEYRSMKEIKLFSSSFRVWRTGTGYGINSEGIELSTTRGVGLKFKVRFQKRILIHPIGEGLTYRIRIRVSDLSDDYLSLSSLKTIDGMTTADRDSFYLTSNKTTPTAIEFSDEVETVELAIMGASSGESVIKELNIYGDYTNITALDINEKELEAEEKPESIDMPDGLFYANVGSGDPLGWRKTNGYWAEVVSGVGSLQNVTGVGSETDKLSVFSGGVQVGGKYFHNEIVDVRGDDGLLIETNIDIQSVSVYIYITGYSGYPDGPPVDYRMAIYKNASGEYDFYGCSTFRSEWGDVSAFTVDGKTCFLIKRPSGTDRLQFEMQFDSGNFKITDITDAETIPTEAVEVETKSPEIIGGLISFSGFNGSKRQNLINDNGTLKWEDE